MSWNIREEENQFPGLLSRNLLDKLVMIFTLHSRGQSPCLLESILDLKQCKSQSLSGNPRVSNKGGNVWRVNVNKWRGDVATWNKFRFCQLCLCNSRGRQMSKENQNWKLPHTSALPVFKQPRELWGKQLMQQLWESSLCCPWRQQLQKLQVVFTSLLSNSWSFKFGPHSLTFDRLLWFQQHNNPL